MNKEGLKELLRESIKIQIHSGHTSPNTGSIHTDFYVYEWIIRETGEVFYVGKGRGKRASQIHLNNTYAERIRELYDTDIVILAHNLNEEEALELEDKEIIRI